MSMTALASASFLALRLTTICAPVVVDPVAPKFSALGSAPMVCVWLSPMKITGCEKRRAFMRSPKSLSTRAMLTFVTIFGTASTFATRATARTCSATR